MPNFKLHFTRVSNYKKSKNLFTQWRILSAGSSKMARNDDDDDDDNWRLIVKVKSGGVSA